MARYFLVSPQANEDSPNTADRVAAVIERHHLTNVAGAGLLASAAYQMGRFDLAEKFSVREDAPISNWVKAKLALKRGDRQSALADYAKALKGYAGAATSQRNSEAGLLRVSRGEYVQALDLFRRSVSSEQNPFADYWGDAAYIAERVLTVAELQSYVNSRVPATGQDASQRLRSLLARRLMRAGRNKEALRYFDDKGVHIAAQQYTQALETASGLWHSSNTRAEAWFTAAMLAKARGMELLGFEREPDYAMWDGNYTWHVTDEDHSYESEDERKRVLASAPARDVRFQYGLTAVDHAMAAADLLPHSSQAFAAVLFEASTWVINTEPKRAQEIYLRYIHQGAYVPWGRGFGRTCPNADFAAASGWGLRQRLKRTERHIRAHRIFAAASFVAGLALAAAFLWFIRRKGKTGSPEPMTA